MPAVACKKCNAVFDKKLKTCPSCGGTTFSTEWMGFVELQMVCSKCGSLPGSEESKCPNCGSPLSFSSSIIASKLGLTKAGRFAIKVQE